MAGKIIADQIEHSTAGSLDTSYVVNGSAKAWVNYDQIAPSVRDSFNVSSATDVSAGIGTINWSNSFSNATYSPLVMGDGDASSHYTSATTRSTLAGANAVFTTSAHQYLMHNEGATVVDSYYVTGQYLGDLA
jgi:hypothetical protein